MGLERQLGYKFKNKNLLKEALTHKSCKQPYNNERLEFLGDAVLDLIVGEYLFLKFSQIAEGDMSKLRAALVNESSFAKIATSINLNNYVLLSSAEEHNGGRNKPSILSDAFEALMGAIYLESGLEIAKVVAIRLLENCYPSIDLSNLTKDYKTTLQELTQANFGVVPQYELIGTCGPDHKKEFEVCLILNNKELARATGNSKKQAQQLAAKLALEKLKGSEK